MKPDTHFEFKVQKCGSIRVPHNKLNAKAMLFHLSPPFNNRRFINIHRVESTINDDCFQQHVAFNVRVFNPSSLYNNETTTSQQAHNNLHYKEYNSINENITMHI
jgi:hypothetical protein